MKYLVAIFVLLCVIVFDLVMFVQKDDYIFLIPAIMCAISALSFLTIYLKTKLHIEK